MDVPARKFNKNVSSDRTDFVNSFKNVSFNIDTNKSSNECPNDSTRTQGTKLITSHALLSPVEQSKCIDSTIADDLRCNGRLQSAVCHVSKNVITTTQRQNNSPLPDLFAKGSPNQPRTNNMFPFLPQMMHTSEGPLCVLASLPQKGTGDACVKQLTKEAEDGFHRTCNNKASSPQVDSLFHASKNGSFNLDRNHTSFNEITPTKYTQSMLSHALVNTLDDLRRDGHPDSSGYPNISPLVDNMSSPLVEMPHTTEAKPTKKLDMIALRALAALESSDIGSSSEDERDAKDGQDQLTKKNKASEKPHTSCSTSDPLSDPLSAPVMQLETFHHSNFLNECCRRDLKPAMIPRDPLDDNWNDSEALEKEIAWLVEESNVLLPASASVFLSENKSSHPIVLAYAWRHGSLELREKILSTFPSKCCKLGKKLNGVEGNTDIDLTLIDGIDMIKPRAGSQPDSCNEKIISLRKEACSALRLGYRRSECIERELNDIQGKKWREAVEEVGDPGVCKGPVPTKQRRQWRKRPRNDALLQTALGQSLVSPSCSQSDAEVAQQIPSVLSPLEDEVAWLVEESLILLPKYMNDSKSPFSTHSTKIESMVSAGLVTQCEINWEYVARNSSENLKDELVRIGGIKRRPLQRIVRFHQTEVRVAFQKRRSDISLLLFRGYRRNETKLSLPSHELLVETGLLNVWAVRQMRRRQNEAAEESVSANELRLACNARLGDTHQTAKNPKRRKYLSHTSNTPTKSHVTKFAIIDKARFSILTVEEEEIAWLREEYEFETGEKCYDWDYIEEHASFPLLVGLAEKSCAPSRFPSAPGISRLRAMVRLAINSVEESFERKRLDIRYAITRGGLRRDRSAKYLPEIPAVPTSSDPPFVRKNGTSVLAIEYPFAECESYESKSESMPEVSAAPTISDLPFVRKNGTSVLAIEYPFAECESNEIRNVHNDECQIGRMKGETVAIFDNGSVRVAADDSDSDEYELSTEESEDD